MRSYVTNRLLRCKRNNSFSEWVTTSAGVQQESTLGPLLFSIFIYDIFLFLQMCDLANYADDSTMYALLRQTGLYNYRSPDSRIYCSKWFYNNFIVRNPDKCSFMLLDADD